jgi:hypothetical protein
VSKVSIQQEPVQQSQPRADESVGNLTCTDLINIGSSQIPVDVSEINADAHDEPLLKSQPNAADGVENLPKHTDPI